MKHHFISLALIFGLLALYSFTTPQEAVANDGEKSNVTRIVEPYEFAASIPGPCTAEPEFIELYGTVTTTVAEREDGNGGYHFNANIQFQAEGVGTPSGNRYKLIASESFAGFVGKDGLPYTVTQHYNFKVIGQGDAPNIRQLVIFKFTVNKNGEITADLLDVSITC